MAATQGLLLNPLIISEETALKIYNKAVSILLEGKTYMQFSGNGTEMSAEFPIPVEQMLSEASYCLQQINPERYGYLRLQVKPIFI